MQLFTIDQIFEVIIQTNELKDKLFDAFFEAALKEITINFGEIVTSLSQANFSEFIISVFTFAGLIVFIYRLVRKKPLAAIKSIFDK